MSKDSSLTKNSWQNFVRAVGADPRPAQTIRGASGQSHPVLAVGVDEQRSRLVLVSGEHDARIAVLAQADIQAAVTPLRVITARPIAVNLSKLAEAAIEAMGSPLITSNVLTMYQDQEKPALVMQFLEPFIEQLAWMHKVVNLANLDGLAQTFQIAQQLSTKDKLENLADMDPIRLDREVGICPVPLYEFSEEELVSIAMGPNPGDVREILLRYDLLQYFFPPPDQLALGLVERGIKDGDALLVQLMTATELGHPLGAPELLNRSCSPVDVIDQLRERKLLVEGEIGYEISDEAKSTRITVKFRPREGFISKVINRFSVNLDLKDLFK